jgi:hypothetical protein
VLPPSLLLLCTFDASKVTVASRLEILATGCIQAPPITSNLFVEVACRTAFYFDLDVVDSFFGDVFFLAVAGDELDFAPA